MQDDNLAFKNIEWCYYVIQPSGNITLADQVVHKMSEHL